MLDAAREVLGLIQEFGYLAAYSIGFCPLLGLLQRAGTDQLGKLDPFLGRDLSKVTDLFVANGGMKRTRS